MSMTTWIDGRRTHIVAGTSLTAITYLWCNGYMSTEAAGAGAALALGAHGIRAGIKGDITKAIRSIGTKAAPLLIVAVLTIGGCAMFSKTSTPAEKAQAKLAPEGGAAASRPPR